MAGDNNDNHRRDDMTGDTTGDNDNDDPRDSPDTPPRKRRIVDVTVDDSDWEDEGTRPGNHFAKSPHISVSRFAKALTYSYIAPKGT
jgi:hypothetical protein